MDRHPFRLLYTGFHDGFYNMGLDEAVLEGVSRDQSPPTLRFYGWSPPAVSVGYFQGLEEEVDLAACKTRGVDVVRRISGGGAVFHHAELTYSVIMADTHPLAGKTIRESYEGLCAGIVEGLALLGVPARFAPINDIIAGDRKISGNAQTRRMGCVLQHGTVILDLDVDLMFELLRVPREKMKGRIIRDVKDRVTSLGALRPAVSLPEAAAALAEGFRRALDLDYGPSRAFQAEPASAETARARVLAAEKFASREWLHKR
ncbi:MAG: lipoate--protein ligase family protein [Spirochaetaceae bacterium]|jgi:lipoate-protein ligase A|nr:lipoate--protein ligase family protein [Spirochaetaceae bacterium]